MTRLVKNEGKVPLSVWFKAFTIRIPVRQKID